MEALRIFSFDPSVYPFMLWVTVGASDQLLAGSFNDYNDNPLRLEGTDRLEAFTVRVVRKDPYRYGVLINFRSGAQMTARVIAHECVHAAKNLFRHIGADVNDDEPFEFLVDWMVGKCHEVAEDIGKEA